MKKLTIIPFVSLLILLVNLSVSLFAQAKEVPDLGLNYFKKTDGSVYLEAFLAVYLDDEIPLPDQYIRFFTGIDSLQEVGSMYTDAKGKAGILIPPGIEIPVNEDGYFRYIALYEGNDTLDMTEMEVEYKDVNLEMRLEEVDSVRTVFLEAYELNSDGEKIPVPEEDVYIFVERTFSNLVIAEDWLDENGKLSFEFPDDLPGDSLGVLTVISMFQDHGTYGNVENRKEISWGLVTVDQFSESFRALWTQYAPTWMVITLAILLIGVWGHYIFVVYKLVQVKRKGKLENSPEGQET